ncbi:YbaB/EbfC family nucleoid-associated protein [Rhodothalassium salexigens]|uniref:YbaB/EbfC family nucleoid-associated protein n=1 Tax=Rhodothalassium salexigens TaxID=1086 RepID=UPI001912FE4C|nr:YbaB/EbfC family nucleoid-associated protein [Rhodothalassium salexigens]MBK5910966.1 YbaB/EbfC family nucleoid-associated protein [Rhodothalassium salexigens]MBK5921255.1 YbaB/EbfC family nucleoid-associated protein [Rhodothalassium salexigens]
MNIKKMMEQAQQMQSKLADMQASLEEAEITGSAGGGMVSVTMNGKHKLLRVSIDPSLLSGEEAEVVEDLIVAAHGDAKDKLDQHIAEQMKEMTGGMGLPPGFKMPFGG